MEKRSAVLFCSLVELLFLLSCSMGNNAIGRLNLSLHPNQTIGIQQLLGHETCDLKVHIRDADIIEYNLESNSLNAKRVGTTVITLSYSLATQLQSTVVDIRVIPNIAAGSDSLLIFGRNLLISYDDSQKTDYTKVLGVHSKFDAPAEFCVWTYQIDDSSKEKLNKNELLTLATTNGNEIVSHSIYHIALAGGTLLTTSPKGTDVVHTNVDSNFTWGKFRTFDIRRKDNTFELVNVRGVEIEKNGNTKIRLAEPLQREYPAGSTLEMTDESIEKEAYESREWLRQSGIECQGFSYPFGRVDYRSEQIIKQYYTTARIASPIKADRSNIYDSIYQDIVPNRFEINALDFSQLTDEEIVSILKKPQNDNFLIVLFSHSYDKNCTDGKIEFLISEAQKLGITITTRTRLIYGQQDDNNKTHDN